MSKADECVKVVVRIRPPSSEEIRNGNEMYDRKNCNDFGDRVVFDIFLFLICSATEAFPDRGLIVVKNPKANESEPPKNFTFDAVFAATVLQKEIYDICAASVVESVLNGYNGTIFAYGQVSFFAELLEELS